MPKPKREDRSGRFVLRLPKSLHESLAAEAEREGVSMNQLVLSKIQVPLCDLLVVAANLKQNKKG